MVYTPGGKEASAKAEEGHTDDARLIQRAKQTNAMASFFMRTAFVFCIGNIASCPGHFIRLGCVARGRALLLEIARTRRAHQVGGRLVAPLLRVGSLALVKDALELI